MLARHGHRQLRLRRALARARRSSASSSPRRSATTSAYVTHIAGRDSLTVLANYAARDRAHPPRHRRGADLHAHTGDHGADRGDDRRASGRAPAPRARRLAPAGRRGLARPDDRQAGGGDARVRRRSCARSSPASRRRPGEKWKTSFGLRASAAARTCRSTSPALSPAMLRLAGEIADGVILWLCNPRLHPRRRRARGHGRAASAPASRSTASTIVRRGPVGASASDRDAALRRHAPRPAALLRPALLPRDARALGLRRRHRGLRRGRRGGDGEGMQAAICEGFLDELCAIGDETTCAPASSATARPARRRPCVGPIPRTDVEATLRAAAPG